MYIYTYICTYTYTHFTLFLEKSIWHAIQSSLSSFSPKYILKMLCCCSRESSLPHTYNCMVLLWICSHWFNLPRLKNFWIAYKESNRIDWCTSSGQTLELALLVISHELWLHPHYHVPFCGDSSRWHSFQPRWPSLSPTSLTAVETVFTV